MVEAVMVVTEVVVHGGAGSMVKNVFEGRPPLIVSFLAVFEIA